MSYDIYVCRFVHGEQMPLNQDIVREVFAAYVVAENADHTFLQLKSTSDLGEADVYLTSPGNIRISHFGGDEIMNIIADLVRRLEAVLLLPGGTVIVSRIEDREHLARDFREEWSVVVASTGAEITQAIQAS